MKTYLFTILLCVGSVLSSLEGGQVALSNSSEGRTHLPRNVTGTSPDERDLFAIPKKIVSMTNKMIAKRNMTSYCGFQYQEEWEYFQNVSQKCQPVSGNSSDCCRLHGDCTKVESEKSECGTKFCLCMFEKHTKSENLSCPLRSLEKCSAIFFTPSEQKGVFNGPTFEYLMGDMQIESMNVHCKRWELIVFVLAILVLLVVFWYMCAPNAADQQVVVRPVREVVMPTPNLISKSDDEDDDIVVYQSV
ncbi:hypothetical protein QR680_005624 [Steinernema hermaphroditum]|uniref:Domain of unknown function DB domain-containing protein n=1 Tax=Steinernema hermaphroditum TaxID=289476 RepID=A0AA39HU17_9BILA|nr:hypothetical protein QR680_005624 [Steinernema hermaphroditum]